MKIIDANHLNFPQDKQLGHFDESDIENHRFVEGGRTGHWIYSCYIRGNRYSTAEFDIEFKGDSHWREASTNFEASIKMRSQDLSPERVKFLSDALKDAQVLIQVMMADDAKTLKSMDQAAIDTMQRRFAIESANRQARLDATEEVGETQAKKVISESISFAKKNIGNEVTIQTVHRVNEDEKNVFIVKHDSSKGKVQITKNGHAISRSVAVNLIATTDAEKFTVRNSIKG